MPFSPRYSAPRGGGERSVPLQPRKRSRRSQLPSSPNWVHELGRFDAELCRFLLSLLNGVALSLLFRKTSSSASKPRGSGMAALNSRSLETSKSTPGA